MCVCLCVCMYIVYIRVCVCVCVYIYICVCVCVYVYSIYMCVCVCKKIDFCKKNFFFVSIFYKFYFYFWQQTYWNKKRFKFLDMPVFFSSVKLLEIRYWIHMRINFFIYCGLFVLILVVFVLFLLHYVSAKFHLWPSSGDSPRPRIGMLNLVTVSPVILINYYL